jgi:carbamoyltransferase
MLLGIHVGHDANLCVIDDDGCIRAYALLERYDGNRHSGGFFSKQQFSRFCRTFGIAVEDIRCAAITSGQHLELAFSNNSAFSFKYEQNGINADIDKWFVDHASSLPSDCFLVQTLNRGGAIGSLEKYFPVYSAYIKSLIAKNDISKLNEEYTVVPYIINNFDEINRIGSGQHHLCGMLLPGTLTISTENVSIPCFFVDHHLAHCASAYAKSSFHNPLVFSYDGGGAGANGNLFCKINQGKSIHPYRSTTFAGGQFYSVCAQKIGLDPGKLMGLSAYGDIDNQLVDLLLNHIVSKKPSGGVPEYFISLFESRYQSKLCQLDAKRISPSGESDWLDKFGDIDKLLACYAACVQRIFEKWLVHTIEHTLSEADFEPDGLILSGGGALNCPANSLLSRLFQGKVFVETSCNDEGLSFGSAILAMSLINSDSWLCLKDQISLNRSPYQCSTIVNESILLTHSNCNLSVKPLGEDWSEIVDMLLAGRIGFFCRSKAELGPRALGNRSIVSLANNRQNHFRINKIKSRELWRPLAPAVLDDDFALYFEGPSNPYMLMTQSVISDELPAITHYDQSARVQVVGPDQTTFFKLLNTIKRTAPSVAPVIVNTSLNGPRQPILDDVSQVLDLLLKTEATFLVTDNYLATKTLSP